MAEWGNSRTRTGTWPTRETARSPDAPSSVFGLWPAFIAGISEWAGAEAGAGRLLPWIPVAFGAGIAFYFAADHEPVAWVTALKRPGFALRHCCCGGDSCLRWRRCLRRRPRDSPRRR